MVMRISLLLMVVLLFPPLAGAYTITLTRQDIQTQVERSFPITEENMFSSITLQSAKVDLQEGSDRLGLIVDAAVSALGGLEISGLVHVDGALKYVSQTGEFLLVDAIARSVDIAGVSEPIRMKAAELVTELMKDYFSKNPIYKLNPQTMAEAMVMKAIKSVGVKDGKLVVELGMP